MMSAMEGFKRGFGSRNPAIRVARNMGLSWVDGAKPEAAGPGGPGLNFWPCRLRGISRPDIFMD